MATHSNSIKRSSRCTLISSTKPVDAGGAPDEFEQGSGEEKGVGCKGLSDGGWSGRRKQDNDGNGEESPRYQSDRIKADEWGLRDQETRREMANQGSKDNEVWHNRTTMAADGLDSEATWSLPSHTQGIRKHCQGVFFSDFRTRQSFVAIYDGALCQNPPCHSTVPILRKSPKSPSGLSESSWTDRRREEVLVTGERRRVCAMVEVQSSDLLSLLGLDSRLLAHGGENDGI